MSTFYKNGRDLLEKNDFENAIYTFSEGIANGDKKCIYGKIAVLAKCKKDFSEFIPQLEKGIPDIIADAEKEDADACFIIGRCFEVGLCLPQDIEKALLYYKKSAQKCNTDAMFNIGCILMSRGLQEEAMAKYFLPAAKLGNTSALKASEHYKTHKKRFN